MIAGPMNCMGWGDPVGYHHYFCWISTVLFVGYHHYMTTWGSQPGTEPGLALSGLSDRSGLFVYLGIVLFRRTILVIEPYNR